MICSSYKHLIATRLITIFAKGNYCILMTEIKVPSMIFSGS